MCDKSTRLWCCRICLVLAVSTVLLTMMFQIWSYYFSLVRDMDDLSAAAPSLGALVSICNGSIVSSWGVTCQKNNFNYNCSSDIRGSSYVDSTCPGSDWGVISLEECCRVMIWILPW